MSEGVSMPNRRNITRRHFMRRSAAGLAAAAITDGVRPKKAVGADAAPDRVFFFTIDTLRSDHLASFGYPLSTTPFLSKLAERGVFFRRAYSACSHTNPAHATIFTGLHVPQHGVYHNGQGSCSESLYTMAEMFGDAGYDTAALCSVGWMKSLKQGFNYFKTWERTADTYAEEAKLGIPYFQAFETVDHAIAWLDAKSPNDRMFVWLHLYDPHRPFHAPVEFRQAVAPKTNEDQARLTAHWINNQHKRVEAHPWLGDAEAFAEAQSQYDAEVRFVDSQVERFYAYAEERGLTKNSVWIFTADHGEGLGSHTYFGHGKFLYQEQLHVLLMFHSPDGLFAPASVHGLVHHVDIMPTLAEMLGTSLDKQAFTFPGESLFPVLSGEQRTQAPRRLYAQRRHKLDTGACAHWEADPICCLISENRKYVYHGHGKDEFYDLGNDPCELRNLIDEDVPAKSEWRARVLSTYETLASEGPGSYNGGIKKEFEEDLRALGYL